MRNTTLLTLCTFTLLLAACGGDTPTPKPKGYFRIELPKKEYISYNSDAPYTFEYPSYTNIVPDTAKGAQAFWADINFKQFNGRIHLSYEPIKSKAMFNQLVEDSRAFAFKHTIKASAINEGRINFPERKVYGIYYTIDGNSTASWAQYFLTDSSKHFLRAALYFRERPKYDSIAPVVTFIKQDIDHMIKTFKWK